MKKRLLSVFLSAVMMLSMLPTQAFADSVESTDTPSTNGLGELGITIKAAVTGFPAAFNVQLSSDETEVVTQTLSLSEQDSSVSCFMEGIEKGDYTLSIDATGYASYSQVLTFNDDRIDITLYNSATVNEGRSEDSQDQSTKGLFGVIALGDIDNNNVVDDEDANLMVKAINEDNQNQSYDLNGDDKVDMNDLAIVVRNKVGNHEAKPVHLASSLALKAAAKAEINENTTPTINGIEVEEGKEAEAVVQALLSQEEDTFVSLTPAAAAPGEESVINEENPVEVDLTVASDDVEEEEQSKGVETEAITIVPPVDSNNKITDGTMTIETAEGETIEAPLSTYEKPQAKKISRIASKISTAEPTKPEGVSVESDGTIVINIGKKVAVKKVSIKITGSTSGKLADIAKVEFLGNFAERVPEPQLSIPTGVTAAHSEVSGLGYRDVYVNWTLQPNVTGYEVSISGPDYNKTKIVDGNDLEGGRRPVSSDGVFTTKCEFMGDSFNGTVNSFNTYQVKVRSINGDWKSEWSEPYSLEVKCTKAPPAPEYLNVTPGINKLDVSWRKLYDTESWVLYWAEWDTNTKSPKGDYQSIPLTEAKYTLTSENGIEGGKTYDVYVTGCNHYDGNLHETESKTHSRAMAKNNYVASMTEYRLINTKNSETGLYNDHIKKVTWDTSYNNDMYGSDEKPESVLFDNDSATGYRKYNWSTGSFTVEFDKTYTIDTIRLSYNFRGDPYMYQQNEYDAHVAYVTTDANTQEEKTEKVLYSLIKKKDEQGKGYFEIVLNEPVTSNKFTVRLVMYNFDQTNPLNIEEARFYYYDSIENDVEALFEDSMRTVLKDNVTEEKIEALIKRANTADPISGEYHPKQKMILEDLDYAKSLLELKGQQTIVTVDNTITTSADGSTQGFAMSLSDYQPLGQVAAANDTIIVYVSRPNLPRGSKANLQLAITQYHPEVSSWSKENIQLYAGRNEITLNQLNTAADKEHGGALYVRYTGSKNNEQYSVRVSGATPIPVLNLKGVSDEAARTSAIEKYFEELTEYVNNLQKKHDEIHNTSENVNVNVEYDVKNCFLNSTEIAMDTYLLSLPATEVVKGSGSASQLKNAIEALEQEVDYFYQFKGLNKNEPDNSVDRYPVQRLNIRYHQMFTGAFMYAGGKHIGIEFDSAAGVFSTEKYTVDENGKKISGRYSGWGIAHEIGHQINSKTYQVAEVTNNVFSMIQQTDETSSSFRAKYEDVYKAVISGTTGHTGNQAVQLAMFWQLHLAYDNNYLFKVYNTADEARDNLFYARVDSYYRDPAKAPVGKSTQIELNLNGDADQNFMRVTCAAAQKNILSFFKAWGFTANEETIAYASQFPTEERLIQYIDDDSRLYRMQDSEHGYDGKGMSDNTKVTASVTNQKNNRINDNKVKISLGNTNTNNDAMLGYEISRDGKKVAFVTADKNEYTDIVATDNNKAFVYTIVGVDRLMNKTETLTLPEVKVSHDGSIDKSAWTITTNMTAETDQKVEGSEEDPESGSVNGNSKPAQKVISEIGNAIDNDPNTIYFGNGGSSASTRPSVTINLGKIEQVTALKFTPVSYDKGTEYGKYTTGDTNLKLANYRLFNYKIETSLDGKTWTTVKEGNVYPNARANGDPESWTPDSDVVYTKGETGHKNDGPVTLYFNKQNEDGNGMDPFMYTYDAAYVRLTSTAMTKMAVEEIDILGPTGDNVELETMGTLKEDFTYHTDEDGTAHKIPKDSYVFFGTYKGDPSYSVVELRDQNNVILGGEQIILADVPEKGPLGETSNGMWIYWMDDDPLTEDEKGEGITYNTYKEQMAGVTSVQAELYRVQDATTMVDERMTSNSLHMETSGNIAKQVTIETSKYEGANVSEAVQPTSAMKSSVENAIALASLDSSSALLSSQPMVMGVPYGLAANTVAITDKNSGASVAQGLNVTADDKSEDSDTEISDTDTEEETVKGTPALQITYNKNDSGLAADSNLNFTITPVNASVASETSVNLSSNLSTVNVNWNEENNENVYTNSYYNPTSGELKLYAVATQGMLDTENGVLSGSIDVSAKDSNTKALNIEAAVAETGNDQIIESVYNTTACMEFDHAWDEGKIIKRATCKEQGQIEHTCMNDSNHKNIEMIDKIDHYYVMIDGKVQCSVCGDVYTGTWDDGVKYQDGQPLPNGIVKENGKYYYYDNYVKVTEKGLYKYGDYFYYVKNETGELAVSVDGSIDVTAEDIHGDLDITPGEYSFREDATLINTNVGEEEAHTPDYTTGRCVGCGHMLDGFSAMEGYKISDNNTLDLTFNLALIDSSVLSNTKLKININGTDDNIQSYELLHVIENNTSFFSKSPMMDVNGNVVNGTSIYTFTVSISPKYLNGTINMQIVDANAAQDGSVYEYNLSDIFNKKAEESESEAEKELAEAMTNYSKAVADYVAGNEVEGSSVSASDVKAFKASTSGRLPSGITYVGSTVVIDSTVTIRHKFKVTTTAIAKRNGLTHKDGTYYVVDVKIDKAIEFGAPQTTKIGNWTIKYSAMSYVYSVLSSSNSDKNLKNLTKALYNYYKAAEAVENEKQQVIAK